MVPSPFYEKSPVKIELHVIFLYFILKLESVEWTQPKSPSPREFKPILQSFNTIKSPMTYHTRYFVKGWVIVWVDKAALFCVLWREKTKYNIHYLLTQKKV